MKNLKEVIVNIFLILIAIFIFNTLINYGLAKTEYETYDYVVKENDTIWNIAVDICNDNEGMYIKNVVNDIKQINDLENCVIYVGQVIKLPIYM